MRDLSKLQPEHVKVTNDDLKILYVDDDPLLCRAFARTARLDKLNVTTATSPAQASEMVAREHFHIIAVDYRMPGMSGVRFLETHKDQFEDAYKIMVTGMCDFETVHEAINRAGVQRYVTKPWQCDELLSVLRDATRHARLVVENRELQRKLTSQNRELAAVNKTLGRLARERTLDVLNALVVALDYRDTETQWHSRRVALFARLIAQQMGISGDELQDIELGAMLHDVGKIGISDTILLKPGKLTDEEWVEMKKHPQLGYDLLAGIDFLSAARKIILHHHERWEGGGYPQGLAAEDISLGARIFSLCDTLDAITSDRPYRKARSFEFAREEIANCSGTQFDPDVAEAFQAIPEATWRQLISFGHAQEGEESGPLSWAEIKGFDMMPELSETYTWQSALKQRGDR